MGLYEFIYSGDVTPLLEEKTKLLIDGISAGNVPFNLVKYYDEEITGTDKKKRTFVLTSVININNYLYMNYFKNSNMVMNVYYKELVI